MIAGNGLGMKMGRLWGFLGSAAIITELSDKRRCMRRHNRRLQYDGYECIQTCACATDRQECELMCHVGAVLLTLRDLYGER